MDDKRTETLIAIAMSTAAHDVANMKPDALLEDKVRTAMKATKGHFLLVNQEPAQLRAACAALLLPKAGLSEEDKARVTAEYKALADLSFLLEAAQRGHMIEAPEMPEHPIGLMAIWRELD